MRSPSGAAGIVVCSFSGKSVMGSLGRLSLVLLLAAVSRASGNNSSAPIAAPSVSGSDVASPNVAVGGSDAASGPNVEGSEVAAPSVDRSKIPESSVSASEAPDPGVSMVGPTRQNEILAVPETDKATYPPAVTVVDRGSAVAPVEVLAEEHTSDVVASTPRTELISEVQHTFLEPTLPTIIRPIKTVAGTLKKKGGHPVKKGKHAKKKHAAAYGSLLFIPLMIQAQIIPIMLLKLKLLAFKALTIGKLALLLLGLNLLRNYMIGYQSDEQQYEHQSLASEHYGYNGSPEYGSWVNRRVHRVEPKIHAELTRITPVRYNVRSSSTSVEEGEVTETSMEPLTIEETDQGNSYSNRRRGALYRRNLNRPNPGFKSSLDVNHPYRGQIFKDEIKVIDL